MNKTGVEYADYSWNPITGCFGPCGEVCGYCYAAGIARRFARRAGKNGDMIKGRACENGEIHVLEQPYAGWGLNPDFGGNKIICSPYPYGFDPTFHKYRLYCSGSNGPESVKKPSIVFVGDMADMFGDWVPDEWIKTVFDACEKAPWHKYLFLTKNPGRYIDLHMKGLLKSLLPDNKNFWYGSTSTRMNEKHFYNSVRNVFVSIEPIQEKFDYQSTFVGLSCVKWVIIGADTSKRKNKVVPKRDWVENIVDTCRAEKIPVFLKNNLRDIWDEELIQEYPEGLK